MNKADRYLRETDRFVRSITPLQSSFTAAAVYNPLIYAAEPYRNYISKFAVSKKQVLFLGMNPGPWGMAQTGIPFGEITFTRDWLGITGDIGHPEKEHEKRPITGWNCSRSEVSGRRLWGLMKERFGTPEEFFKDHFVENYCPLVFMGETGKNITPDKLLKEEREPLFACCDRHLNRVIKILEPTCLIGIGKFAEKQLKRAVQLPETSASSVPVISSIIHPSPANPQANKDWQGTVTKQLVSLGIWEAAPYFK